MINGLNDVDSDMGIDGKMINDDVCMERVTGNDSWRVSNDSCMKGTTGMRIGMIDMNVDTIKNSVSNDAVSNNTVMIDIKNDVGNDYDTTTDDIGIREVGIWAVIRVGIKIKRKIRTRFMTWLYINNSNNAKRSRNNRKQKNNSDNINNCDDDTGSHSRNSGFIENNIIMIRSNVTSIVVVMTVTLNTDSSNFSGEDENESSGGC